MLHAKAGGFAFPPFVPINVYCNDNSATYNGNSPSGHPVQDSVDDVRSRLGFRAQVARASTSSFTTQTLLFLSTSSFTTQTLLFLSLKTRQKALTLCQAGFKHLSASSAAASQQQPMQQRRPRRRCLKMQGRSTCHQLSSQSLSRTSRCVIHGLLLEAHMQCTTRELGPADAVGAAAGVQSLLRLRAQAPSLFGNSNSITRSLAAVAPRRRGR
jgi:hypothetical protein